MSIRKIGSLWFMVKEIWLTQKVSNISTFLKNQLSLMISNSMAEAGKTLAEAMNHQMPTFI
jgi:hypothetical protein